MPSATQTDVTCTSSNGVSVEEGSGVLFVVSVSSASWNFVQQSAARRASVNLVTSGSSSSLPQTEGKVVLQFHIQHLQS